jgi:hypothetical protein
MCHVFRWFLYVALSANKVEIFHTRDVSHRCYMSHCYLLVCPKLTAMVSPCEGKVWWCVKQPVIRLLMSDTAMHSTAQHSLFVVCWEPTHVTQHHATVILHYKLHSYLHHTPTTQSWPSYSHSLDAVMLWGSAGSHRHLYRTAVRIQKGCQNMWHVSAG